MQLHQLLRFIHTGCPISIFDLQGIEIFKCRDKDSIPQELFEYDVLDFTAGWRDLNTRESAIFIMIQK